MKLDRTKPYGEIIGSTDGSKYDQGGIIFDINGFQLGVTQPSFQEKVSDMVDDVIKRKPGRPFKNV